MTVWSLTPFRDELDLLEIRLAELDSVVNMHVITEGNLTQSGEEKPFNLEENWARFEPYWPKIRYVKLEMPGGTKRGARPIDLHPIHPSKDDNWKREHYQRQSLVYGLDDLADDDLVLISDLDEIPRASTVEDVKLVNPVMAPRLPWSLYYLNYRLDGPTEPMACVFTSGHHLKGSNPQKVVRGPRAVYGKGPGLGFHFSWLGGVEAIQKKLSWQAHQEVNREPFNTREHIEECLRTGADLFGREDRWMYTILDTELPQYVQDNREKFAHLLGTETLARREEVVA